MKSNLTRWVSPWDPRGMSVWGTVATLILSVGLWRVNGTLSEVWPNRCSLLRGQLEELASQSGGLNVIAESAPQSSDRADKLKTLGLWELRWPLLPTQAQAQAQPQTQEVWLVPRGLYTEARVKVHRLSSGELTLLVELITRDRARVTSYLSPERDLSSLFDHLVGSARSQSESRERVSQRLREISLRRLALERAPSMITCQPERAERELVMIASLMLKDEGLGLTHAWRLDERSWLTERLFEEQRQRRLYQVVDSLNTRAQSLWLSTWQPELIKNAQTSQSAQPETPPAWLLELARGVHELNASPDELNRLSSRAPTGVELKVDAQRSLRDAIKSAVSSP